MSDVVFIAVALGFFAICALYVHWCDSIIDAGSIDRDDRSVES